MSRLFRKVLVANRGEIAVRIIRALRELGIGAVAIHSEADATAPHVRVADEVRCVGPTPVAESYLAIDRILSAARDCGAEAIHPGYGFLAENAEFARAVDDAGLVFIGPPAAAIDSMGDKGRARAIAEAAGVPTVPGRVGVTSDAELADAAREIGYPVMLKAAAGGGGKGMRIIESETDVPGAVESSTRVAESAFGDGTLVIEKLVRPARHVEIQVFADTSGQTIALGERECSLQRRQQKILEECPSPSVDGDLRCAMSEAAVALARAVDYVGAGTVEFLLDPGKTFYFLEMNTRLQVEHAVTEEVWGVDLVKAQVAVAAGNPLPATLTTAQPRGHAIEVRLYAEDPDNDFLPSPGRIHEMEFPSGPGIRVDLGVSAPGEVSAAYDPMIAKIVARDATRDDAVRRLRRALECTHVLGVRTNAAWLGALVDCAWFRAGDFDTRTIEDRGAEILDLLRERERIPDEVVAAVVWALSRRAAVEGNGFARHAGRGEPHSPFVTEGRWRPLERDVP